MQHSDHVRLIRNGIAEGRPQVWADLGCGRGAFTLALADILGAGSTIYAVDRSTNDLATAHRTVQSHFPQVIVHPRSADFTRLLDLPPLDGILIANALHFVRYAAQENVLRNLKSHLKENGRFVLVEYNAESGNLWVPYPISLDRWKKLAKEVGFSEPILLDSYPSRFLKEIYSAAATVLHVK